MEKSLIGFGDEGDEDYNECTDKRNVIGKKSGGFQSMGLSYPVLKGIQKRGYKIPTPIQRKTIPLVMQGRDVVAMARTGSGKTACFLVPMFELLKERSGKAGARALILTPTRELALQTMKFIKELGKFTNLVSAVIVGGDSMDNQFTAIHGSPDIIVATPGRFLHICVEMDLKLGNVQYVVFDEADRLFEMGFGEQLWEIVNRLPDARQTVLFSATLPKVLVEFAKAGLSDPVLLRLDLESKLPEGLELSYVVCRSEEKQAALICLLKYVIKPDSQTIIFAATKHHVEYLHALLNKIGIDSAFIYSNLDPAARKINAAKFQHQKVPVLIVTDVAARGIDIPQLDNVINYNFPAKPKLFVHRVGRCARAGRKGLAYSVVSHDEKAYLLDLYLFLGHSLDLSKKDIIGRVPGTLLEEEQIELDLWHKQSDLEELKRVSDNGYKQYIRSRPGASTESLKRAKVLKWNMLQAHSMFNLTEELENEKLDILARMRNYRPPGTVFEVGESKNSQIIAVMKETRKNHLEIVSRHRRKLEGDNHDNEDPLPKRLKLEASSSQDIDSTFTDIVKPKKVDFSILYKKKKHNVQASAVSDDYYVPHFAPDHHREQGLSVNSFQSEAKKMQLDITADTRESMQLQRKLKRWDSKKKKIVSLHTEPKVRKIRTESGVWLPATFKSDRYAQWKEKNKADSLNVDSGSDVDNSDEDVQRKNKGPDKFPNTHWGRHNVKVHQKKISSDLKNKDQILKARLAKERILRKQKRGRKGKKKSK